MDFLPYIREKPLYFSLTFDHNLNFELVNLEPPSKFSLEKSLENYWRCTIFVDSLHPCLIKPLFHECLWHHPSPSSHCFPQIPTSRTYSWKFKVLDPTFTWRLMEIDHAYPHKLLNKRAYISLCKSTWLKYNFMHILKSHSLNLGCVSSFSTRNTSLKYDIIRKLWVFYVF